MHKAFSRFAVLCASMVGSPWAFIIVMLSVIVWLLWGPATHFSAVWQLVCNTVSTIATTLIVVLLQNTTNRDMMALQLKLDELIRASDAHDAMVAIEHEPDTKLRRIDERISRSAAGQADPDDGEG